LLRESVITILFTIPHIMVAFMLVWASALNMHVCSANLIFISSGRHITEHPTRSSITDPSVYALVNFCSPSSTMVFALFGAVIILVIMFAMLSPIQGGCLLFLLFQPCSGQHQVLGRLPELLRRMLLLTSCSKHGC
jgi:hypothetical protein